MRRALSLLPFLALLLLCAAPAALAQITLPYSQDFELTGTATYPAPGPSTVTGATEYSYVGTANFARRSLAMR